MNKQDKELLLKDLCARLPYGVICKTCVGNYKLVGIDETTLRVDSPVYDEGDGYFNIDYMEVKPYLRPMSSMTEEERKEYLDITSVSNHCAAIDYLNAHHFDYRGLIPMGLALSAPESMYNK